VVWFGSYNLPRIFLLVMSDITTPFRVQTLGGGDTRLGRLEVICRVAPQRSKSNYSRGAGSRSKASAIVLVEGSSVVLRDPRAPSAEAIK